MEEGFPTDTVSAMLEYYSDKKLHHKVGSIDLTTCEEVYSALDSETYKHVFCIQVYYSGIHLYVLLVTLQTPLSEAMIALLSQPM